MTGRSVQDVVEYAPIGYVSSPHVVPRDTPIQPVYAEAAHGYVEIHEHLVDGLRSLEGYSHIYLIYHLHRIDESRLLVTPFLQDKEHGIFATRAPWRPNPIGLSIVRLVRVEHNRVHVTGLDLLDGTPILDIKPYAARFDCFVGTRNGWQDEVDEDTAQRRGQRIEQGEGGHLQ